ncbi:glutamate synthase large subunit [Chenggangzhangella methanolivorans]|uniref:Glutamate synthase [NADPH] large chain n=1 Tax=Chenggangzhangella methanolivorans TaxID=1437009 RepID=A0A9E6RAI9_9HYPH|nr:glutamate synthase large subunit [Chenggangzhangella methanolivorans]QZO01199.1 glutamate synthase large subunit [Chenggangzhangella methanolivorans]
METPVTKRVPAPATDLDGRAGSAVRTIVVDHGLPKAQGLYDPRHEKDSCGVGFVADMKGRKSHTIIEHGLKILENLEHRGAVGADPRAGDGAGMLVQIPHKFFAAEAERLGFELPEPGMYAVGHGFGPRDQQGIDHVRAALERAIASEGHTLLGWREVPTDNSSLGESVKPTEPTQFQVFIGRSPSIEDEDEFERRLFILRKIVSNEVYGDHPQASSYYPVSLSCRTIVYKGMFLADQLAAYYPDLKNPLFESALALVHQRFSTNTFPAWSLAHPYRMVAHNGEINTLRGNVNWMAARQASVDSELYGNDISKLWPISYEGQSDTACLDNALEFLVRGGYSLVHAMMVLVPEAWAGNPLMDEQRRAFYEYHAAVMEPWDGPAAVAFTDGRQIGATLDRNGLRPARWYVTDDDLVVMASEMGVLPFPEEKIVRKWRLQPGRMLLIDLTEGRIVSDEEIKASLTSARPYKEWLKKTQLVLEDLPDAPAPRPRTQASMLDRQQAFGYTQEDVKLLMSPMATTGQEAVGSMGTDTPLSALSRQSKLLYSYFKQNFAQVTNPPIDPIREELVMSLVSFIGPRPNLFDLEGSSKKKRLEVRQPILSNEDLEKIRAIDDLAESQFQSRTLDTTYPAEKGAAGMADALERLCERAQSAVHGGFNIVILSDRLVGSGRIAIPAALATAAVHHHLIRKGLRTSVGLVIESGEPREVHHFAVLAGYGAEAINPYLAFETLEEMHQALDFPERVDAYEVRTRYIKSIGKGLLKVMSKMGISTYQSYCGAQIFDAVGLSKEFVDKYFSGTATPVGGVGLAEVAEETVRRHTLAFSDVPILRSALDVGGEYAYRIRGEDHAWTPNSVANLQHAVRTRSYAKYEEFARDLNEQSEKLLTLRGLFRVKNAKERGRDPVAVDDVEPAAEIVKRFVTGAMSFGSISREAHESLAIAMNRIGGKSNTGEGGEEPERFVPLANGDSKRSAIKQVASGRFGVTAEYLVNADMIQIKVAQGAKPGEGGQLPGHKVDAAIAKVRRSTQGVGLISPPPHHDIYSIEDLAQLIYDLKNVNPASDISVKLVSEVGVGTVAAGVAKARADHITISGFEGGTGASPLTSLKHAGGPWETGLAETQQTLVMNKLRGRVRLQVDGGLRTGRDVLIGALLGADEFGFSTAPLIAAGCLMMRKCHLNTCPVGIATQDPVLRKRFKGTPENVIDYLFFVAEEVRGLLAEMGFSKLDDVIGRSDLLDKREAINHWKARGLDFSKLFAKPVVGADVAIRHAETQDHHLESVLDRDLIAAAAPAIERGEPVTIERTIASRNRSAGAMLSGAVAKAYGSAGLPDDTITVKLTGTAGQSFGAFLAAGVTFDLTGEANDYVGKGLSGGRIIVRPAKNAGIVAEESIIVGNTVLYGAIEGECYFRGVAGERFAVRNSGAIAVVEGSGDHGCEYMTGGVVVVLGKTGRNFAAGMSGGVAYVLDEAGDFAARCNLSMVDLEPVPEEEELMQELHHHGGDLEFKGRIEVDPDMTRHDEDRLKQLITAHHVHTESTRAKQILDNWADYRSKFVKVMPVEYRKALREMEKARALQAAE